MAENNMKYYFVLLKKQLENSKIFKQIFINF